MQMNEREVNIMRTDFQFVALPVEHFSHLFSTVRCCVRDLRGCFAQKVLNPTLAVVWEDVSHAKAQSRKENP
jgi:hypothetical protein